MRRLVFRLEARAEIAKAAIWYEDQGIGLGAEFLRAADVAISSIQRNPQQYQRVRGRTRKTVLRRFPYNIVYVLTEDEIVVVGCVHGQRNPKRWQDRS
jgi:plasmid stabilization system protein ParE